MSTAWTPHKYLPLTAQERAEMLRAIGVASVDELLAEIPAEVRLTAPLHLPPPMADGELLAHLRDLAEQNGHADRFVCFLGAGAYDHWIPSVVWHLAGRAEFYTAYTPYQAEVMQGELQATYEYQTMLCELTGMDVANASMYDGASAVGEAAVMARDLTRREEIVVSTAVHPHYREVLRTYTRHLGIRVIDLSYDGGVTSAARMRDAIGARTAAVVVQSPNVFGCIEDGPALARAAHEVGALLIVAVAEPLSMGLLAPPGHWGADIVAGEGQPLGNALSFGGPYLGMLATRDAFVRRMPGRLVGATVDRHGRRGFVLTLQTREQHIRREKATSNICTNEALNALAAGIYMAALGKTGMRRVAEVNARRAHYARTRLCSIPGVRAAFDAPVFNEFTLRLPVAPEEVNARLLARGILGGLALRAWYPEMPDAWLVCVTEARTRAQIDALVDAVAEAVTS
ncbi:MAG: aminomethyl-transferring glycine dehydrogenase subunit GcvPA [Armatimonadota bacterium]|nr:aminomethyl-transferring glycine dehydrogenase subunit GcvPA [Armatimonadota bacterium]MDR7531935.1 aminomethyl-transferring glycine dehydrogenase subunit GcvPA [Armatimonadota bacterium]